MSGRINFDQDDDDEFSPADFLGKPKKSNLGALFGGGGGGSEGELGYTAPKPVGGGKAEPSPTPPKTLHAVPVFAYVFPEEERGLEGSVLVYAGGKKVLGTGPVSGVLPSSSTSLVFTDSTTRQWSLAFHTPAELRTFVQWVFITSEGESLVLSEGAEEVMAETSEVEVELEEFLIESFPDPKFSPFVSDLGTGGLPKGRIGDLNIPKPWRDKMCGQKSGYEMLLKVQPSLQSSKVIRDLPKMVIIINPFRPGTVVRLLARVVNNPATPSEATEATPSRESEQVFPESVEVVKEAEGRDALVHRMAKIGTPLLPTLPPHSS